MSVLGERESSLHFCFLEFTLHYVCKVTEVRKVHYYKCITAVTTFKGIIDWHEAQLWDASQLEIEHFLTPVSYFLKL